MGYQQSRKRGYFSGVGVPLKGLRVPLKGVKVPFKGFGVDVRQA